MVYVTIYDVCRACKQDIFSEYHGLLDPMIKTLLNKGLNSKSARPLNVLNKRSTDKDPLYVQNLMIFCMRNINYHYTVCSLTIKEILSVHPQIVTEDLFYLLLEKLVSNRKLRFCFVENVTGFFELGNIRANELSMMYPYAFNDDDCTDDIDIYLYLQKQGVPVPKEYSYILRINKNKRAQRFLIEIQQIRTEEKVATPDPPKETLTKFESTEPKKKVPKKTTEKVTKKVPGKATEKVTKKVPGKATEKVTKKVPGKTTEKVTKRSKKVLTPEELEEAKEKMLDPDYVYKRPRDADFPKPRTLLKTLPAPMRRARVLGLNAYQPITRFTHRKKHRTPNVKKAVNIRQTREDKTRWDQLFPQTPLLESKPLLFSEDA